MNWVCLPNGPTITARKTTLWGSFLLWLLLTSTVHFESGQECRNFRIQCEGRNVGISGSRRETAAGAGELTVVRSLIKRVTVTCWSMSVSIRVSEQAQPPSQRTVTLPKRGGFMRWLTMKPSATMYFLAPLSRSCDSFSGGVGACSKHRASVAPGCLVSQLIF